MPLSHVRPCTHHKNNRGNYSDIEGGAAENASREVIPGTPDLSEPPEPLSGENQEPVAPIGASEQGSMN